MTESAIVHVLEDDAADRTATARFLQSAGYCVRTYATATEFFGAAPARRPGCVVLDLQLPEGSGLDVQQTLADADESLPVVFLTGHCGVAESVRAMKVGAVDFLTKTCDGRALIDAVTRALMRDAVERERRTRTRVLRARYALLSQRERDVFAHLISGQLNKQIGHDLGIAEQTTKIHRHRVMVKMEADSIAALVRMAEELGIGPVGSVR